MKKKEQESREKFGKATRNKPSTPAITNTLQKTKKITKDTIPFMELHALSLMLSVGYKNARVIKEAYGSVAHTEMPKNNINYFVWFNESLRTQKIIISGTWKSGIQLKDDLLKQTNLRLFYSLDETANHIGYTTSKYLRKDFNTVIAGHSLGSTIAILLGVLMHNEGYIIDQIVTFGQPRFLAPEQCENVKVLNIVRVLSKLDPVVDIWQGIHIGTDIILLKDNFYSFSTKPDLISNVEDRQLLTDRLDIENRFSNNHIDAYSRLLKSKFSGVYIDPGNLTPYSGEVDLKKSKSSGGVASSLRGKVNNNNNVNNVNNGNNGSNRGYGSLKSDKTN